MTLLKHRGSAALLLVVAFLLSSCQKPEPIASEPPLPPPITTETTPTATGEHPSTELLLRPHDEPRLPAIASPRLQWTQPDSLSLPLLRTPEWVEPEFTAHPPELLIQGSQPLPDFSPPTGRTLPLQVRHPEIPSLPHPDLNLALSNSLTSESLQFRPEGGKLRPRSPYCMPGHTSQNFVLYSVHDGLPLHPGVW